MRNLKADDKEGFWFDLFAEKLALEDKISGWESTPSHSVTDRKIKEQEIKKLKDRVLYIENRIRFAKPSRSDDQEIRIEKLSDLISFKKALTTFFLKWGASQEEVAAWVSLGPNAGGLSAYIVGSELHRFCFEPEMDTEYVPYLFGCKFDNVELQQFDPSARFITGHELFACLEPEFFEQTRAYITARVADDSLKYFHPIVGVTDNGQAQYIGFPPIETALFSITQVLALADQEAWNFVFPARLNEYQKRRESPEERKDRLHRWFDEEMAQNGKRGALTRTAQREKITPQTLRAILDRPQ